MVELLKVIGLVIFAALAAFGGFMAILIAAGLEFC